MQEKLEDLGNGLYVATSKDHKFGTDSFLVSSFAKNVKQKDIVADFGTGCGIIAILLYKYYMPKKIYAFDILKSATNLAEKSVLESKLKARITVINKDIKSLDSTYFEKFDKIICNPPYKAINTGAISKKHSDKIIRHETTLTIEALCEYSFKYLKFGGSLILCQRAERLVDTFFAMRNNNIEPKILQFCSKNKSTAPWLFLVEGKKFGKPFLKVKPSIFMYKENSN